MQAAGLVETLSGEGELTVFAPTDAAFADALEALGLTADELLADTDTLTSILTYHVVPGEAFPPPTWSPSTASRSRPSTVRPSTSPSTATP
ncbi:MAG: fasciclin domain-containing protein [Ilumatobacteraceae bacterium]